MENTFFDIQTESSYVKAKIVAEYFPQYCKIILKKPQKEIWYLDLFSGPGKYKDGKDSTPLLIAKSCSENPVLAEKVRLLFNDRYFIDELKKNFYECFNSRTFALEPRFGDRIVGEDDNIKNHLMKYFGKPNPHPTLLFFDPWGYKGIDSNVLAKFLSNWGNEIFLFVNIKRIHAAIENNKFDELMENLFPTTISDLRKNRRYKASTQERINLIMDSLATEFKKAVPDDIFHCAFKFQEEDSSATSHFILHLTKHQKGYELIKQIYYDFDNIGATLEKDGVYTFDAKKMVESSNSSFNFGDQNVQALSDILQKKYKGRKLSAKALFNDHHPSSKFCGSHYAKTLRDMVDKGKVKSTFSDNREHKVSVLLTDQCILEFI